MDSVTHILLGGALAQLLAGRRAGYGRTFLLGALAATLPDLDVFLHTGNTVTDHALHRHFMHSLLMVPLLALVAWSILLIHKGSRRFARPLYAAALLACASHTVLDSLTSYGTVMFWPFTERRLAFDIIAVIDPLYTLPLLLGVGIALWKRSTRAAALGLVAATIYLGVAIVQHERAMGVQRQLIASRGVTDAQNARVLPQLGAVVLYRSLYLYDGRIYADAIRPGLLSPPTVKPGESVPLVDATDLRPFPAPPQLLRDFDSFAWFTDGYVARSPADPLLLIDERYATTPEGIDSVWGVQLEETTAPKWVMQVRWGYTRRLVTEIFRPHGYIPLAELHTSP